MGKIPHLAPEYLDEEKTKFRKFWDMLDIYPVQLKADKKIEDIQGFDWEDTTKEQQESYMKNFESM